MKPTTNEVATSLLTSEKACGIIDTEMTARTAPAESACAEPVGSQQSFPAAP